MNRPDDLGYFGPHSVTWRVHAEPILWLAGFRALLLQMLHPRVLAGVLQNSTFRTDPWGRLMRTAEFYADVIFGDTRVAQKAAARVRRVHARLQALDAATGEWFRIDEPELLRWVHVTATESFCHTARRAGLALRDEEVDQYYKEQLTVASLLGLDPDTVPDTAEQVHAYYETMRPHLIVDEDTWATVHFLAVPTFPFALGWTPVRPLWIGLATYAFNLLPAWARRLYGMPGLPTTDLAATLASRTLRSTLNPLARRVLAGPRYRDAMARASATSAIPAAA